MITHQDELERTRAFFRQQADRLRPLAHVATQSLQYTELSEGPLGAAFDPSLALGQLHEVAGEVPAEKVDSKRLTVVDDVQRPVEAWHWVLRARIAVHLLPHTPCDVRCALLRRQRVGSTTPAVTDGCTAALANAKVAPASWPISRDDGRSPFPTLTMNGSGTGRPIARPMTAHTSSATM